MRMIAFLAICLTASGAAAGKEKDCSEARNQAEMNVCEGEKLKRVDAAFNDAYAKLTAKVSAAGKAKLVEAQRAWLKYRDAQCAFETLGTAEGSIHPVILAQCYAALTREQTKRLLDQINCEEGDLSCGGQ